MITPVTTTAKGQWKPTYKPSWRTSGSNLCTCTHRSYIYIYIYETHWYRVAIYFCQQALNQRCRDNAPNLCTSSCNERSGRSVGCAANYQLHLCNKINTCICYKICFITLLITNMFPSLVRSSSGLLYKSTKNAIICHMEYREPLNIIINVSNIEYFNLHTFLTTLLALPRWWWQKWLIHVGN